MKSIIVKSFDYICQFGVVALILAGGLFGYQGAGIGGAIGGIIGGLVASILVFGVLFILMEIRDNTQKSALAVAALKQNS